MPAQLGGAPDCPVCGQKVYYYESKGYMGRTWHKKCFNCVQCSKVLESGTANLLEDMNVVCNSCFRKLVGTATTAPKRQEYVNPDDPECCPRCGRRVYFAEQLLSLGRKWHKSCYTCAVCKKKLDSTTEADHEGELYCKGCHGKNFGPKGYGFAGGAGTMLSMETGKRHQISRSNVPHTAEAYNAPLTERMRSLDLEECDGSNGVNGRNGTNGHNNNGYHGNKSCTARRFEMGDGDFCPRCDGRVFIAEKRQAAGNVYHEKCFTCFTCNKKLDSSKLTEKDREIFCKVCYGKKFGPKGYGYGGGAGALQMTS